MSNKLKFYRLKCGYTQDELADELNITTRTLQNYESGKSVPDVYLASKISDILLEDITTIFEIEEE